jgi:hypothetical protein
MTNRPVVSASGLVLFVAPMDGLSKGLRAGTPRRQRRPRSLRPSTASCQAPQTTAAVAPFGARFPSLAPGQEQSLTDAELARALGWFGPARIGLVPASRPADVLALVGYNGIVNWYGTRRAGKSHGKEKGQ